MSWKIEEFADVSAVTEAEVAVPENYNVILFNDDFTTKEFVVSILVRLFRKSETEAVSIMETVHRRGAAIVGSYSFDIAATLVAAVIESARDNGFPLRCEMEVA